MKKRRFFALFLVLGLLVSLLSVPASAFEEIDVDARAALLVEKETGEILYEKNAHEKNYPASITKLTVALLVFEAIDAGQLSLDQPITARESAFEGLSIYGSTAGIKVGDVVEFTGTKHYVSATATSASSCKPGKAKVTAIAKGKAHPYHLIAVSGGGSTVYGWTDAADIKTSSSSTATSYLVKVTTDVLNIRKGPGTNYGTNGAIRDKGTYTIVAESDGPGASKWGKLKSGAGWISLDYTKKV